MSDELSDPKIHTLDVASFYGVKKKRESTSNDDRKHISTPIAGLPHRLNNLLGPTQVWKVFKKQAEALEFAKKSRNGVMTFAFQQSDSVRLFLVAHPKIFWHYDVQKSPYQRCSYEVIPESTACKLYFDIEFETEYNQGKEGSSIVHTFITVISYFLSTLFRIQVSKEHVLNLDSSTEKKFSCHLIFQLGFHAFSDNKSAGAFINFVCRKLNLYFDASSNHKECLRNYETELSSLSDVCGCCITSDLKGSGCIKDIGLSSDNLNNLLVFDRKGNRHLISDLSVYSRNRHFRLFQNTKWRKNSPLIISKDNCYLPPESKEYRSNHDILNETVFLDSLITYFRTPEANFQEVKVIDSKNLLEINSKKVSGNKVDHSKPLGLQLDSRSKLEDIIAANESPYPLVDKFINSVVFPGYIWRSTFFNSTSIIVYDILGNRYCHNIRRQHQSNNVKYVVNLNNYVYYQKCHDPECASFRSETHQLPPELKFQLEDEIFDINDIDAVLKEVESRDNSISEHDLLEAASVIEDLSAIISDDDEL